MSPKLAFPHPEKPLPGTAVQVAPGILWVRMPLPFQLDHINLWLLEDGEGWTIVDSGLANDTTRGLWEQVFVSVLGGRPVRRVIATHFHPDHMGLAGWLTERWGVDLWTTLAEWLFGRMLCVDGTPDFVTGQVDFYRRCGFDEAHLKLVEERANIYATRVSPIPVAIRRIAAGQEIEIGGRQWRVIVGTGHSPEHACLYCAEANVLISGDQILPKISPIVGVWPMEPEADPLGLFLASLSAFRSLPADVLVLPSHGLPFTGLHHRLDELDHHHDDRLARTLEACASPATGWDILKALFRRELDTHQTLFAVGEGLAHANYLVNAGQLVRETRADGVWLYRRAG